MKLITAAFALLLAISGPASGQTCTTGAEPVPTHWKLTLPPYAGFFSLGDTDARSFSRTYPYTWDAQTLPDYQQYVSVNNADLAVSQAEADTLVNAKATLHQKPFRLLNAGIGDVTTRLVQNQNCVQIVHGLLAQGSFYTAVLPPNWNPSPGQRYPILVFIPSPSDVNASLFGGQPQDFGGQELLDWIASTAPGGPSFRTGAIGVIWNGGGSGASVSADPLARSQFATIIDTLANLAGADRDKVIVGGGSRGGVAALMVASNPEQFNYRVRYVVAMAPGTMIGTSAELIDATLRPQIGIGLPQVGYSSAWEPNWMYPASGNSLSNQSAVSAFRRLVGGFYDKGSTDAFASPIGDVFVNRLMAQGVQVVLAMGTHDEFVPFGTQLQYLLKLRNTTPPPLDPGAEFPFGVEAHIVQRGGHSALPNVSDKLFQALLTFVDGGISPNGRKAATGPASIKYYAVDRNTLQATILPGLDATTRIPFNVEVPRVMYGGTIYRIHVSGHPLTQYTLVVNGQSLTGTIPSTGWTTHPFMTGPSGWLTFNDVSIVYPAPYSGSKSLSLSNVPGHPTSYPAATYVADVSKLPLGQPGQVVADRLKNDCGSPQYPDFAYPITECFAALGGFSQVNWGVSEW